MRIKYLGLNFLLALPLPVWGFVSSLEPWQQALVAFVGIPVFSLVYYAAMGLSIGLHNGLKVIGYKALTGGKRAVLRRRRRRRRRRPR